MNAPYPSKPDLLELLRRQAGEWVSGETLRQPSGVSRAAISKQVRALVALGYQIESSPRKGYRLLAEPESLDPDSMRPRLLGTRFARAEWVWTPHTGSTNDDIRRLALAGAPEGSVAVTDFQTAGRGRRGRSWFGAPGESLQFSILLRPPIDPRRGSLIPLLAAVAVREALAELGAPSVGIKWPNDILLGDRKLCGILCEMSLDLDRIESAAVGIGLNVNTPLAAFPAELRPIACSLAMATGRRWNRAVVLAAILRSLEALLAEAWTTGFDGVFRRWRQGSVTLGRPVIAHLPDGRQLPGIAEDLADDGALILRLPDGSTQLLHSGEVTLRPPA